MEFLNMTEKKTQGLKKTDFSKGPVWKCVISQAVPLTIAQLVHLLYNVVDRIYLGHLEGENSMALTGVGLTFPVVTLIMAFTALFGVGGVPLFPWSVAVATRKRQEGYWTILLRYCW